MRFKVYVVEATIPRPVKRGLLVAIPVAAIITAAVAYAAVHNFQDGETLTAQNLNDSFASVTPPTGTIVAWAGDPSISTPSTLPIGWVLCDGTSYSSNDSAYNPLYNIIKNKFGGSVGYFNVPDLRGRVVLGLYGGGTAPSVPTWWPNGADGGMPMTTRDIAQSGGEEAHTLALAEMPAHAHALARINSGSGSGSHGFMWDYAGHTQDSTPGYTDTQGQGAPHDNMPPYLVLNYIIKL